MALVVASFCEMVLVNSLNEKSRHGLVERVARAGCSRVVTPALRQRTLPLPRDDR